MSYLILFAALFLVGIVCYFLYDCLASKKVCTSEKFGISIFGGVVGVIVIVLVTLCTEEFVKNNVEKYQWEAVYDKAYPIVLNGYDKVTTITDDRGEFYRFTIVNDDNEFELVFAHVDDVEKIVICGVKPYFVPVKEYHCVNQPKIYTLFGFMENVTVKPTKTVGKLIIDEDFYIESYKYELVKLE
jgi:hypothetical protein